jgi:hypothetical protein
MNRYFNIISREIEISSKGYIGHIKCDICRGQSTAFHNLHEISYFGLYSCENVTCISAVCEKIEYIFNKYPLFDLSIDRDDLKHPDQYYSNLRWSSFINHDPDELYYFDNNIAGLVYLYNEKMYINIISTTPYKHYGYISERIELKKFLEYNSIDPATLSLPDPVKEYLGIPIHDYLRLHFVD